MIGSGRGIVKPTRLTQLRTGCKDSTQRSTSGVQSILTYNERFTYFGGIGFMYCDERQWREIRRRILEQGARKKRVSAETGISRQTINKMLAHEKPPGYRRRRSRYPKLAPHIHTIDQLLIDNDSFPLATIQDIVRDLRSREGFAGSYDSVRNYIHRRAHDDQQAWDRAYDLIIHLPKPRALDLIRHLSGDRPPASTQLRLFIREPACRQMPPARSGRKGQRLLHIEWMRRVLQKGSSEDVLHRELGDIPDLSILLQHLHNGRLSKRNRAMVVLASRRKIPSRAICAFLGVSKAFVCKYRQMFDSKGAELVFAAQTKSNRKIDNEDLRRAIFSLLHQPPANHGINRTSWTMALLRRVLKESGTHVGTAPVAKVIKAAGYKWRNAKIVLTSNDPTYKEKLARIRYILSSLQPDEAFFSIDEYGPFAIKAKPGRTLVAPGIQPTVPQWQKSRGCLIMTAALELSGNQVTYFYSAKKNTTEMIRMLDVLIDRYRGRRKLYLSWDAASWHISKQLFARIDAHNLAVQNNGGPFIETAPLPAGAQFLNVIESVFSGMARAIIHNSDYKSLDAAKAAIDQYFGDRNAYFHQHPKRAGKKIWGSEREPSAFSDANNCKDPQYR
jgi:transposase